MEQSLVSGGRAWEDPLNMVSQGLSEGANVISGTWSCFGFRLERSP